MVKLRDTRGFTLTEAILTVAIVGIVSATGSQLMIQANRYYIMNTTKVDIQREARAVMYVITRELHQAVANTIKVDRVDASQPFYSRITFTKSSGGTLIFEQSGTSLIQIKGNNSQTLTKNVNYLAFTFPRSDDMTIISVSMTLQRLIYQGRKKALHMASEKVQVMN